MKGEPDMEKTYSVVQKDGMYAIRDEDRADYVRLLDGEVMTFDTEDDATDYADGMKFSIHLCGYVVNSHDGWTLDGNVNIAKVIAERLSELAGDRMTPSSEDKNDGKDDTVAASVHTPEVAVKIFTSSKKCSISQARENQILASIGELDIFVDAYGYSEFTIMGYDTLNFKLVSKDGEHCLDTILKSNEGKYMHIVIALAGMAEYNETAALKKDDADGHGKEKYMGNAIKFEVGRKYFAPGYDGFLFAIEIVRRTPDSITYVYGDETSENKMEITSPVELRKIEARYDNGSPVAMIDAEVALAWKHRKDEGFIYEFYKAYDICKELKVEDDGSECLTFKDYEEFLDFVKLYGL